MFRYVFKYLVYTENSSCVSAYVRFRRLIRPVSDVSHPFIFSTKFSVIFTARFIFAREQLNYKNY